MNATTPVNPPNHVDEVTGLLYIEGQLEPEAARGVVAHLEQCSACRRLLDTLKRESLLLRAALTEQEEPLPARLLAPPSSEGISWGWLIALGLAAAGLYTFWNTYVGPWMDSLDQSGFGGQFMFTWLMLNGAFWKGWNDMLQLIALGLLGALGAGLLFLFRRSLRKIAGISVILLLPLVVWLANPPAAQATEFIKTNSGYEVPAGETRHTDVFVLSSAVRIDGMIDGDLFCFCHTLTIEGHVTGDVFAFANTVLISGKVDGNVRTFNETLTLEGGVGRNVMSFVAHFRMTPRSDVKGSATLFAGNMQLDGPVGRDLAAFLGDGTINAPVNGDVRIRGRRDHPGLLQVTSHADIKGSFLYKGRQRPDISPQARLASAPQIEILPDVSPYREGSSYRYNAFVWGMAFVVGLLLISVAPGLMQDTSREVARIGLPLGLGLVVFIVLPISAVLACITVVGLGVGVSAFLIWLFLMFFAQVFAALWLGESILGATSGTWPMTGRLALGLFLLRLGALIPYVGFWVRFVSCVLGIGGLALVIFRHLQRRTAGPPAAPVSPAPVPAGD